VVYHLSNHAAIPRETFEVKNTNGYDNLIETLEGLFVGSELERLGIIVDADVDVRARWESVRNKLRDIGYTRTPEMPDAQGSIIYEEGKPTVGIWIMPDNQLPGMIEDFIALLIPQPDSLWIRVQNCVDQLPENERRFSPGHLAKVYIHTWLAWQEEPGTPMGHAITKRYLDANLPTGQSFIGWLTRLFLLP
jgi:hypothetical protein